MKSAVELRAERHELESRRRTLRAVVEVHASHGRVDHRDRALAFVSASGLTSPADNPLAGCAVEYDGEVIGVPGVEHVRDAAAQLTQLDLRLREIDGLLPDAEERDAAARKEAQREAEQRRREQAAQRLRDCTAVAADVATAETEYAGARAALHDAIARGPLGAVLRSRAARVEVARRFAAALPRNEDERDHVLNTLGTDGLAARRALSALPGSLHPAALPPVVEDSEFDWFIDALLGLPILMASVRDLNQQVATLK